MLLDITSIYIFEGLIFLNPGPSLQQRLTFHRQEWRVKDVRLFERIASLLKWSDRDGKGFLWQNLGLQQRSSFVFFVFNMSPLLWHSIHRDM